MIGNNAQSGTFQLWHSLQVGISSPKYLSADILQQPFQVHTPVWLDFLAHFSLVWQCRSFSSLGPPLTAPSQASGLQGHCHHVALCSAHGKWLCKVSLDSFRHVLTCLLRTANA